MLSQSRRVEFLHLLRASGKGPEARIPHRQGPAMDPPDHRDAASQEAIR